jgi:FkbM family methyltransferase
LPQLIKNAKRYPVHLCRKKTLLLKNLKLLFKGKTSLHLGFNPLDLSFRLREPDSHHKLVTQLTHHAITHVLDVGANKGQFALALRRAGFAGDVTSFEPLPDAHAELVHFAKNDARWHIAQRAAVGAKAGVAQINVSQNSHSSSLLPVTATSTMAAPSSAFIGTVETPMITLDNYDLPAAQGTFIKVDTQGFEMEVLKGATKLLKSAKGVQLEMSFTPMYEGAPDFETLYRFMIDRGFVLWGMDTAFRDPKTRRLYQVDATFFRNA